MEPTTDNLTSFEAPKFPTTARYGNYTGPDRVFYYSKKPDNNVTISIYRNDPAAEIDILPTKGYSKGAARDVWDFIDNILPDCGTLASIPSAKTISQLSPIEKMVYLFTNRLPKPTNFGDYSLDVARQLYGFYTNPVRAAKIGIKVEISPNTIMDSTNSLSRNFDSSFPDIRALAPEVDLRDFAQWTPEQVNLWNQKYTKLNYPPIDPETRTMPYLILKKSLKRNSYVSFQHS